ncbi:MAG TPA: TonB family protein [Elusimicrobiota bacterium]|nr:TonB family protein [Elusimicrobiota bacterium]
MPAIPFGAFLRQHRLPPFETALLVSFFLHVAAWQALTWKERFVRQEEVDRLEIDLTRPFRLTDNPFLARRAKVSGTGAPIVEKPKPVTAPPAGEVKPPSEWVLPGPDTKELEKPVTAEDPSGLGGFGVGEGGGEVDWVYLTSLPQLLNRDALLRNLRRYYPESERRAGREGQVVLDLHIDRQGSVTAVDVVTSAGAAFDAAAEKVIRLARFSPAKVETRAVPVKIRQTVAFQLEE